MFRDTPFDLLVSCLLVWLPVSLSAAPALVQSARSVSKPPVRATARFPGDSADRGTDGGPADSTGTLTVRVVGLDSDDGNVQVELTTAQNYEGTGSVRRAELPIQDRTARWTLRGVPYGTYAVSLYHDQNDNDELDTNVFGVPQEPYGFSNDARGTTGRPDFEEAAFTLSSDSRSITITAK